MILPDVFKRAATEMSPAVHVAVLVAPANCVRNRRVRGASFGNETVVHLISVVVWFGTEPLM